MPIEIDLPDPERFTKQNSAIHLQAFIIKIVSDPPMLKELVDQIQVDSFFRN